MSFAIPGGWVSVTLLVVSFATLLAWSWVETQKMAPARRRLLRALRLGGLTLALACALQPRFIHERIREVEGRLVVLVDGSRSMRIHRDDISRLDTAHEALTRWGGGNGVELWRFGDDLSPMGWSDASTFAADDEQSRMAHALKTLAADGDLGAVVVLSDGATQAEATEADLDGLRVHTVALGGPRTVRDDAIAELQADSVAFLRGEAQARVVLRRLGGEGGQVPVSLVRDGAVVSEQVVSIDGDGDAEVLFRFTPRRLGRAIYEVRIPMADDDAVPENNVRPFLVRVTRDRLRVLLVAGHPTWDVRFLRSFLERDPSVDLISFFILRTTSDLTMAAPDELALIPFPTDELFREHLGSFDVLLFQDFDFGPYQMAPYLPRIRDYVRRGGSFAMIGGDRSFGSGGYAPTAIADVLPVELPPADAPASGLVVGGSFRPQLEPELSQHPLVALLPSADANRVLWEGLAPVTGANRVGALRDGAHVLLGHPEARVGGEPMAVLSVGGAGEGRVLALGIDGSWRWGMTTGGERGDGSAHERFWDRALRWLARDPNLDAARITTDRERYGPGGSIEVMGWLRNERYQAIEEPLALRIEDADGRAHGSPIALPLTAEGAIEAHVRAPLEPGAYRVVVTRTGATSSSPNGPAAAEPIAMEPFVVEAGGDELAEPRPDPDRLRSLATATGGEFFSEPARLPPLDAFDTMRRRALGTVESRPFSGAGALWAMLGLFAAELFARRRWGLR